MYSKQEESELEDLKSKIETGTSKQKEHENITQFMSRTESLKKRKETGQDRKETQKNLVSISRLEISTVKKFNRIQKINFEIQNIQTSTLIGLDFNQNEYWVIIVLFI